VGLHVLGDDCFLWLYFKFSLYTLVLLWVRTSGAPLCIISGKMLHLRRTISLRKNQKSLVVFKFTAVKCKWFEVSKHKQLGLGRTHMSDFFRTNLLTMVLNGSRTSQQFLINFWHEVLRLQVFKLIIKRITFRFLVKMKYFLTL
jgi:hypothetical protein